MILVNVWIGTPFFMIMFLAGLKSIPDELYEAATIDGAGGVQRLRSVTHGSRAWCPRPGPMCGSTTASSRRTVQ